MSARVKIDVSEFCEVRYLLDIPVLSIKGLLKKNSLVGWQWKLAKTNYDKFWKIIENEKEHQTL
jgi:hypothetical protein